MQEKIGHYLDLFEKEHEITILLACETGSRAWGFPSPDSDFDIRLIYSHKKDWYLTLNERKDTIEMMLENNQLDISGWDLRKSLRLLSKSNPPMLERIQSPIVYRADNAFLSQINSLATSHYSKIATMHHYLSMANKMIHEIESKTEYKLKQLFYALRTSIACKWILDRDDIPPIQFEIMLKELDIATPLKSRIQELVDLKSMSNEGYVHIGEGEIKELIRENINRAETIAKSLPPANGQMSELDIFFRNTLSTNE